MAALGETIRWLVAFAVTGFWPFVAVLMVLLLVAWMVAMAAAFTPIRINITREGDYGE